MRTINVAVINNISLQVVADEREQLVAVKPVCEILGVDFSAQRTKLKEHPLFSSIMVLSTTVGADGKDREMVSIPLRYFPSWLFSINPNNVKEEIRENILQFQIKCNDVLFDYFFNRADFALKKERAVARAKEVYDEKTELVRVAKSEQKVAESEYNKALAMTFEDYTNGSRQLTIQGFQ